MVLISFLTFLCANLVEMRWAMMHNFKPENSYVFDMQVALDTLETETFYTMPCKIYAWILVT